MLANQYILGVSIDSSIISPHLPGQNNIECIEVILLSVFHFKRKIIIIQLSIEHVVKNFSDDTYVGT